MVLIPSRTVPTEANLRSLLLETRPRSRAAGRRTGPGPTSVRIPLCAALQLSCQAAQPKAEVDIWLVALKSNRSRGLCDLTCGTAYASGKDQALMSPVKWTTKLSSGPSCGEILVRVGRN